MARILLIEDDANVQRVITSVLRNEGHQVAAAGDGDQGLAMAAAERFDLYLLDVTLPTISGLDVAIQLREMSAAPIVLVTGRDTESDMLTGLALGADDYVTKPFSPAILAARVRNALRRAGPVATGQAVSSDVAAEPPRDDALTCGALRLDLGTWTASLDGEPLSLTTREFKLLSYLMRHQNRVVTRVMLLDHVWGEDFDGSDRVVDVSFSRLRRHLMDRPTCPLAVQAVPGVGYKIVVKADPEAPDLPTGRAETSLPANRR